MSHRPRLLLSWSTGKDSAWTSHRLCMQDRFDIVALVTTVNEAFDRVAMPGRCSAPRSRLWRAKWWSATGSCSPT